MKDLTAISGLALHLDESTTALEFSPGIVHPAGEKRTLSQVRSMLQDAQAQGPEHLYTIYMDIARQEDIASLREQGLLYGAVVYNSGTVGQERLRSQGHVHSVKPGTGLCYSEVYEFWTGKGLVYLQKECASRVSRAFIVPVKAGDKLVIPFGWVHLVVTQGDELLSFGAWCARENRLEYELLRALGGPAYFFQADGTLKKNPRYEVVADVQYAKPDDFPTLGIPTDRPIYTSWREQPERYRFMAYPEMVGDIWADW
jgi:glucose-6-phosphate isomerase